MIIAKEFASGVKPKQAIPPTRLRVAHDTNKINLAAPEISGRIKDVYFLVGDSSVGVLVVMRLASRADGIVEAWRGN